MSRKNFTENFNIESVEKKLKKPKKNYKKAQLFRMGAI
jgi:hypothetical protein